MSISGEFNFYYIQSRIFHLCVSDDQLQTIEDHLQPADVILTCRLSDAIKPITGYQYFLGRYPSAACAFTHVALYVGGGYAVHAVADVGLNPSRSGGVIKVPLSQLVLRDRLFVLLRARDVKDDIAEFVVESALNHIGLAYDYVGIVRSVTCALAGPVIAEKIRLLSDYMESSEATVPVKMGRALVCSDFVYSAFDEVYQAKNPCNMKGGRPHGMCVPCEFYANPNFMDVLETQI